MSDHAMSVMIQGPMFVLVGMVLIGLVLYVLKDKQ